MQILKWNNFTRFEGLSRQVLNKIENLYQDVVNEYGEEKTDVQVVAKRLSKLRQLNNPKKIKGINDASFETKDELSRYDLFVIDYIGKLENLFVIFVMKFLIKHKWFFQFKRERANRIYYGEWDSCFML